jgi:hypothetical protein
LFFYGYILWSFNNFPCHSPFFPFYGAMSKLFRTCKSFALASLALASTALSGMIFSAKSEQEVCDRLNEVLARASPTEKTCIFVDIDDTLIRASSDYDSFRKTGTFAHMKIANEPLIRRLRELEGHPFVKTVALTSARTWVLVELDGESTILDTVPFAFPENEMLFASTIRSDAMEFLGLPFKTALKTPVLKLPFVTQPVTLTDEVCANLQPIFLPPELQGEQYFSGFNFFLYFRKMPFRMLKREFYRQVLPEASMYERIIGWPVYENGVIYSNFFDQDEGWQKGLVMRSFLQVLEQDEFGMPSTIIAIDDNLSMHQNMEQVVGELGITFFGIHYQPPKIAPFWIFGSHPPHP